MRKNQPAEHPVITQRGQLQRYLSEKYVRAAVVDMTDIVAATCQMQKTSPSASVALGRTLVSAVLLASHTKDNHEVALQFSCSGPLQSLFAHAGFEGHVRGTVSGKNAPMSIENGAFSLKPLVKDGTFAVTTYIPKAKQPRRSQLEIVSGEIGEDVAHYLSQSMQISSLLSLGVKIGSEGVVLAAGGVLIEMMPGYTEETLSQLEASHAQAQPLSDLIEQKSSLDDLLKNHTGDLPMVKLAGHDVVYRCSCTREKAVASVELLGKEDVKELVKEGNDLPINCDMCGLTYDVTLAELNLVYKKISDPKVH